MGPGDLAGIAARGEELPLPLVTSSSLEEQELLGWNSEDHWIRGRFKYKAALITDLKQSAIVKYPRAPNKHYLLHMEAGEEKGEPLHAKCWVGVSCKLLLFAYVGRSRSSWVLNECPAL